MPYFSHIPRQLMGLARPNPTYVLFTRWPRSISLGRLPHGRRWIWGTYQMPYILMFVSGYDTLTQSYQTPSHSLLAGSIWGREPKVLLTRSCWASHLRQWESGWADESGEDDCEYFAQGGGLCFEGDSINLVNNSRWPIWWVVLFSFELNLADVKTLLGGWARFLRMNPVTVSVMNRHAK